MAAILRIVEKDDRPIFSDKKFALTRLQALVIRDMAMLLIAESSFLSSLRMASLLYLCDREMIKRYARPISYDIPVIYSSTAGKAAFTNFTILLSQTFAVGALDKILSYGTITKEIEYLSEAEKEVVIGIAKKHKRDSYYDVSEWIVENCTESKERLLCLKHFTLTFRAVAEAVGFETEAAKHIDSEINYYRALRQKFDPRVSW